MSTILGMFYPFFVERTGDHLICIHFLEKCRKVVLEFWFEKSGSRNLV